MGTSKSTPSPDTPPWRPVRAVLGREGYPADRQATEIWRGAFGERGTRLIEDFSQASLALACRSVNARESVQSAVERYDAINVREGRVGLAIELGRRALVRSAARQGTGVDFAAELFSEATAYYASRDLSSFVSAPGRIETTSDAIKLKSTLRAITAEKVRAVGRPPRDLRRWSAYVENVLSKLRGID